MTSQLLEPIACPSSPLHHVPNFPHNLAALSYQKLKQTHQPVNISQQKNQSNFSLLDNKPLDTSKYASVLDSCKCPKLGKQVHAHTIKTGFDADGFVDTKLLQMYARCGLLKDADFLFWVLADTGTEPPVRNRGVPAGIRPDFPELAGIFTGTKTSPFCPGFCNGTGRSGRSGRNGTGSITLLSSHASLQTHKNPLFLRQSSISCKTSRSFLPPNFQNSLLLPNSCLMKQRIKLATCCSNHRQEPISNNDGSSNPSVSNFKEEEEERKMEGLEKQSIWEQMKEIVMFTGPATGLWLCGPLMSLIDTAVIGQGSSLELAALGPGTVICDYTSYVFMFLSIATSNLVATSLARQDKKEVQHQISILLFVGLTCGFLMLLLTKLFGPWALTAFAGPKNLDILPAANTYVQIRALAWPTVLVGWVAQSASLGMKDSWGPLKALAVASAVNGIGDIVLCIFLGYGIAGAAWATMVSQVVAAYMMIETLNKKGYNGFTFSVPSWNEVLTILGLAAPLFVMMISRVAFWALVTYFATSLGTNVVAAHQVMIQSYGMCSVWGQPLSQTAQSFMPELIYGINRNLSKARILLSSLVIIGATLGLVLGIVGTSVPWFFPNIFTPDQTVIQEMHKVLIPYFIALSVSPGTHSLDGALLAGRDLKFISLSTFGCFSLGAVLLILARNGGYGLPGCWFALVGFQWARFFLNLQRLLSPDGVLYSEDMSRYNLEKLKEA